MATKQRYQNPALGDDIRLQSFVFNNGMDAFIKTVAKVEIFRKNPAMASMSNPEGLSLVKTIVSHLGQPTTEIFAYPSASSPEYWETNLHVDEDTYEIADYVDRWHYILDEEADFLAPASFGPYQQADNIRAVIAPEKIDIYTDGSTLFQDENGDTLAFTADNFLGMPIAVYGTMRSTHDAIDATLVQIYPGSVNEGGFAGTATTLDIDDGIINMSEFFKSRYQIPLTKNRQIRTNGITDGNGSYSGLTYTDAIAAIGSPKAIQSTTASPVNVSNPSFTLPGGFFSDPLSIAGYVLINFTDSVTPTGGENHAYFKVSSSDGINWTGTLSVNPDNIHAYSAASVTGTFVPEDMVFNMVINWNVSTPSQNAIVPFFVTEWRIADVEYSPGEPNAWDALIANTAKSKKMTVDHQFTVFPEQWFASSRPIRVDYGFDSEPSNYYLNTRNWMSVRVKPSVPLNPETQRYHFTLLAAGKMRYEIYKINENTTLGRWRKLTDGIVYWHEENVGLLRMDTTTSPLNKPLECFIVFFIDLPDGSTIRSGRLFFNIIDDLNTSTETPDGAVF